MNAQKGDHHRVYFKEMYFGEKTHLPLVPKTGASMIFSDSLMVLLYLMT